MGGHMIENRKTRFFSEEEKVFTIFFSKTVAEKSSDR